MKIIVQVVFLFWGMMGLAACKTDSGTAMRQEEKNASSSDFSLTLEMNPLNSQACDLCIRYKLFIFADGTVVYDGIDIVKTLGVVKTTLPKDKLNELKTAVEKSGYENFLDRYDHDKKVCAELWTDNSLSILTVVMNGKTKSVVHYWGCRGPQVPPALIELQNQILQITNAKQWIGAREEVSNAKLNPILRLKK